MKKQLSIPDLPSNLPPDHQDFFQALKQNIKEIKVKLKELEERIEKLESP